MSRYTTIPRPTEAAAIGACKRLVLPSADQVADRLIVARATHDRYGARHFSNLLDRILEGAH
ncbi:hypothetical protein ACIQWB_35375 [Streptomyces olivaceus]|uniref:hypothetical protein n=1 Tax=Streptomyces olivaceus TaxID=47716 RepID=UPI003812A799